MGRLLCCLVMLCEETPLGYSRSEAFAASKAYDIEVSRPQSATEATVFLPVAALASVKASYTARELVGRECAPKIDERSCQRS